MRDWRLIQEDGVTAAAGLAADETLAQRVGAGTSPATLRLYTYQDHCALVGRFQDVEQELCLPFCQEHGISANRRPTGGGAILMGRDQLGVALTVQRHGLAGGARQLMARFSEGLTRGLEALRVEAMFLGKNDLQVGGCKIAGLGIFRHSSGGLLFHASLLVDLDLRLMAQVLKTPFQSITDRELDILHDRITTVRGELGRNISLSEVRDQMALGFALAFDLKLRPDRWTAAEQAQMASLEVQKYRSEEWLRQVSQVPNRVGVGQVKTPGGVVAMRVALAGRMLKAVFLSGDFFATEDAVADLEASLRWHACDQDSLMATLKAVWTRHAITFGTLTPDAVTEAVLRAAQNAHGAPEDAYPYGCFLLPEDARG